MKILLLLLVLFNSVSLAVAASPEEDLLAAIKDGTPTDVEFILQAKPELDSDKTWFLSVAWYSKPSDVLQNMKLLHKYGYAAENEYQRSMESAIRKNHIDVVKYLDSLDRKLLNAKNINSYYQFAFDALKVKTSEQTIMAFLVKRGLDVNHPLGNMGVRAGYRYDFFYSASQFYNDFYTKRSGREAIENALITLVSYGVDVNLTDYRGNTVLHRAAGEGSQKELDFLIQLGVNPSIRNEQGKTAQMILDARSFHEAIKTGTPSDVERILKRISEFDSDTKLLTFVILRSEPSSVLPNMKLLLKYGYQSEGEYRSAMHAAIEKNYLEVMKYLVILDGELLGTKRINRYYQSAFKALLKHPAGETAMDYLIKNGLNLNNPRDDGYDFFVCAEHYYAGIHSYGVEEINVQDALRSLVRYGVNVNLTDKSGETVLHESAYFATQTELDFFIQLGVDPAIKNNQGETAQEILDHRRSVSDVQRVVPYVVLFITIILLILSYIFRDKSGTTRQLGHYLVVRILFAIPISLVVGILIAVLLSRDVSTFEGGQGYSVLYYSFICVPISFFILLTIKNTGAILTLVGFSVVTIITGFLYL